MRIAAGPLQQASLSRRAIWWRGRGDSPFNLAHTVSGSAANGVATSRSTAGSAFAKILFAVDVPRALHLVASGVTMLSDEMDYSSRKLRLFEGPEGITLELVQRGG
jgi:hypothetical protein